MRNTTTSTGVANAIALAHKFGGVSSTELTNLANTLFDCGRTLELRANELEKKGEDGKVHGASIGFRATLLDNIAELVQQYVTDLRS